jgi:type IV secretory pathway VirB3-like protein
VNDRTEIPVLKALNKRVLLFGIPWRWLLLSLIPWGIGFYWIAKLYTTAIVGLFLFFVRRLNKVNPRFARAAWLWWRCGRHAYDAGK